MLAASTVGSAWAQAVSPRPAAEAAATQQVSVRIVQSQPSVSPTGTLQADIVTSLTADAEYFEVRFQLKSEDGRLLYQKTEVRHNVKSGRQIIRFTRELQDHSMRAGSYPIEVRVLATGSQATQASSRLLVLDKTPQVVPVAIMVRLTSSPGVDPNGRFLVDPAENAQPRNDAERLADIVTADPGLDISLAMAPLLIEEWSRASDGYEYSGPGGVASFAETDPGAIATRDTLERLRELLGGDQVHLLDVPYSDPDIAGLSSIGAISDLDGQWRMTDSVMQTALASEVSSGAAFLGDVLHGDALPALARRGVRFTVLSAASARVNDSVPSPGVYDLGESGIRALILDPRLNHAAAENTSDDFYDALFERALSENPTEPVVMRFEIGPGKQDSISSLERALSWLESTSWVDVVPLSDAAEYSDAEPARLVNRLADRGAPAGYWSDVAEARLKAEAVTAALGAEDTDARSATNAVYVSQSLCWAGPDREYALAEQGRAFAASAVRYVDELFAQVSIGARDVTLSNRTGEVPVSVVNNTGKQLNLRLVTSAERVDVGEATRDVTLDAGENVLTLPVDMGSELSDEVSIRLTAGAVTLTGADVNVQASYLDRLATLGMVFVFLLLLLLFIRRRVRSAGAGNMPEDPATDPVEKVD